MREDWLTRRGGRGGGGAVPGNQDHIMRPATVYKTGENLARHLSSRNYNIFASFHLCKNREYCSWKHYLIRGGGI